METLNAAGDSTRPSSRTIAQGFMTALGGVIGPRARRGPAKNGATPAKNDEAAKDDTPAKDVTPANDVTPAKSVTPAKGKDAVPDKAAGDTAPKTAGQESAPTKAAPNPVPVALELGWTMAVLYGQTSASSDPPQDRLPTGAELGPVPRIGRDAGRGQTLLHTP